MEPVAAHTQVQQCTQIKKELLNLRLFMVTVFKLFLSDYFTWEQTAKALEKKKFFHWKKKHFVSCCVEWMQSSSVSLEEVFFNSANLQCKTSLTVTFMFNFIISNFPVIWRATSLKGSGKVTKSRKTSIQYEIILVLSGWRHHQCSHQDAVKCTGCGWGTFTIGSFPKGYANICSEY